MSNSLSVASVIEKNRLSSDVAFIPLVDIEVVNPATGVVVETLHYARNSEDVVYRGTTYLKGHFDIELKSEAGTQPTVQIVVRDLTRDLQSRMQAYGGGVGFNVTILVIFANGSNAAPEAEEFFQVIAAQAQDYIATFTLGAENALLSTFPRRTQRRDFCGSRYKDADTCGYTGLLPSCDFTLQGENGCAAHANTHRFGAYPGINGNGIRYV